MNTLRKIILLSFTILLCQCGHEESASQVNDVTGSYHISTPNSETTVTNKIWFTDGYFFYKEARKRSDFVSSQNSEKTYKIKEAKLLEKLKVKYTIYADLNDDQINEWVADIKANKVKATKKNGYLSHQNTYLTRIAYDIYKYGEKVK